MLLIIDIFLTVVAWRNGWRALALLPMGVTVLVGFLLGAAVQASGGSIQAAFPVAFLADLINLGVLIGMATRAPTRIQPQEMAAPATPTN